MRKSVKRSMKRSSKRSMKRQARTKSKKISKRRTKRIKRTKLPNRSKGSKRMKRTNRSRIKSRKYRQRGGITYSASLEEGLDKGGTPGNHHIGNVVNGIQLELSEATYVVIDWKGWGNYTYKLGLVKENGEIAPDSQFRKLNFSSKAGGSILKEETKDTLREACSKGGSDRLPELIKQVYKQRKIDAEDLARDEKYDAMIKKAEKRKEEEAARKAAGEAAAAAEAEAERIKAEDTARILQVYYAEQEKKKAAGAEKEEAMKELDAEMAERKRLLEELGKKRVRDLTSTPSEEDWSSAADPEHSVDIVATPETTRKYLEDFVKINSLEKDDKKTTWTDEEIEEGLKGLWTQEIFKAFRSNTSYVSAMKDLFARRVEYKWDQAELQGALANYMTQNQLNYCRSVGVTLEDTNPFGENNSVEKADERAAADAAAADAAAADAAAADERAAADAAARASRASLAE